MQFQLPGTPLFPAATDGLLLKPTLRWEIYSAKAAHVSAEMAYITRGFGWQATYNIVAPESKDVTGPERVDVMGWVTIPEQQRDGVRAGEDQADGGPTWPSCAI